MIQLQDGRLMACCESGGIKIAFSSNMGSTWTSPTKIATNPSGIAECVPDLIQLSDGTIIVAYNPRPGAPYSTDRRFGIRCKRSTDNGVTWSNEIFVNDASHTFEDGCWEPSMLELPSGELQLYFADEGPYTYSGEQQISMCRSFDKGLTWGEPEKICFRAGSRDGMPVPILLKDKSEIVVIIEDNGWGYGDFFPTTVRCPLNTNWNNYWVNNNSSNRQKTLDFNFCPVATGGAPYLRQLPNGETVMSYQSSWEHNGKLRMLVAMGDEKAKNFKNLSEPFAIPSTQEGLWNSVAVIDTGVVVAVSGFGGSIEMIKGFPKSQFECTFGHPTVDGKATRNEGYSTTNSSQFKMGWSTGDISIHDFAYDADSLYYIVRVSDDNQITSGNNIDGVRLFIDAHNTCDTKPVEGNFAYFMRLDNQLYKYHANGRAFTRQSDTTARMALVQTSGNYVLEIAIPWSDLELAGPPLGQRMAVNIEVRHGNNASLVSEFIPDTETNSSWTWMTLHLVESEEYEAGISNMMVSNYMGGFYDLSGRRIDSSHKGVLINNQKKFLNK